MKNNNHNHYTPIAQQYHPNGQYHNPRLANLLQYNISSRTSPFRSRTSTNPSIIPSSTRASPTMLMRNVNSDLNKQRINSAVKGNFNSYDQNQLTFHNDNQRFEHRREIVQKYTSGNREKKIVKNVGNIGNFKDFGKNKNFVVNDGGNRRIENLDVRSKEKKFYVEKTENIVEKNFIKKSEKIPQVENLVENNLESLLSAHDQILSKALNIKNYENNSEEETKKKSLISSIRKNILTKNKEDFSSKEIIRKNEEGKNFNPQVYSNLQIVNSNIYFPVVKNDKSVSSTPIRVERKFKTENVVRIEGKKKDFAQEKKNEENEKKIFVADENEKHFFEEGKEKNGLSLRYEDTLDILKNKVEEIKSNVLEINFEVEEKKINYEKSKKEKKSKIKKKIYDEILNKSKNPTIEEKRPENSRIKKSKRKIQKSKNSEKASNTSKQNLTFAKVSSKSKKVKKKSKKSKFLQASESRELNKFDLSLVENTDMEYDSMILGRRKNQKNFDKKNFQSLPRTNHIKPRFKNFKESKFYSNKYKKNLEKKNEKIEKNEEIFKLLENVDNDDFDDDIDNVKFEVSSVNSDFIEFGKKEKGPLKGNLKKEKEKGYSEITKNKLSKKRKIDSYFSSERDLRLTKKNEKKEKKVVKSSRKIEKIKNTLNTSKEKHIGNLSKRTTKTSKQNLENPKSKKKKFPKKILDYTTLDQSKKLFQNSLRGGPEPEKKTTKKFLKKAEKKIDQLLNKFKQKDYKANQLKNPTKSKKKIMSTSFEQTRDKNWFGSNKNNHESSFVSVTYEADLSQFNPKSRSSSKKGSILEPVLDKEKRETFKKEMSLVKEPNDPSFFTPSSLNSAKLSLKSSSITDNTKKFKSRKSVKKTTSRKKNYKNQKLKKNFPKFKFLYYIDKLIQSFQQVAEEKKPVQSVKKITFEEHFTQSTQSVIYIQNTSKPTEDELLEKKVYLPPLQSPKKKTLIFDLDETLIHCNDNPELPCDIKVPIKFTGGDVVEAGLVIRPYAVEALSELSQYYEIVVFTASHACYANIVLNLLDPENKIFTFRLFREHCVKTKEGIFIKDLRVFANRKIKDLIIVDNAFYSFGFQIFNGVPILPFYDDKMDCELQELAEFLKVVKDFDDVREPLKKVFMGDVYGKYANRPEILRQMIINQRKKL